MSEFVTVGKSDEIGESDASAFQVGEHLIAVARVDGELLAFSDICTHRGCNISAGSEIEDTTIQCECHGSKYDIGTGERLEGATDDKHAHIVVREAAGLTQLHV